MSTVLDALKKLQSERDREGGSGPGALREGVVDGGSPAPKRRRWVLWLVSLAILVMAGAAAGYFLPGTREDLLAYILRVSPKKTFLVHGDLEATEWFADQLREKLPDCETVIPRPGVKYTL